MKKLDLFFIALIFAELANAQITFQKLYHGIGDYYGTYLLQTNDSGYVMAGAVSNGTVSPHDFYLIKTNVFGDTLWTKTYGGVADDFCYSIEQTAVDSGYLLVGYTESFGTGSKDVYLIKTDFNGNALWSKTYGGTGDDVGYCVRETSDSGFIIVGYTKSFGSGLEDIYVIRTNNVGDTLWIKTIGGVGNENGWSILETNDSAFVLTGFTGSFGSGDADVYLIKINSSGTLLWSKTYGGIAVDVGYSVLQADDKGFIISGYTTSFGAGYRDVFLIKTDSTGNALWSKTYGDTLNDEGLYLKQTSDGGYIIVGYRQFSPNLDFNVYLIKCDSHGDTLWTKFFGGTYEAGLSILQAVDGGYAISGYSRLSFTGYSDAYLIKTDSSGDVGCYKNFYPTVLSTPLIFVTYPATIVSSGTFITNPLALIGNAGTITSLCSNVAISEIGNDNIFSISPNPSSDNLAILFERPIMKGKIEILNILGKDIYSENIFNESKKEININNISDGLYFVKVFSGGKCYCKKLIIE